MTPGGERLLSPCMFPAEQMRSSPVTMEYDGLTFLLGYTQLSEIL